MWKCSGNSVRYTTAVSAEQSHARDTLSVFGQHSTGHTEPESNDYTGYSVANSSMMRKSELGVSVR